MSTNHDPLGINQVTSPRDHVVRTFRDLKGRYVAEVEREGAGRVLGHSWSSYEAAARDASAYMDREGL